LLSLFGVGTGGPSISSCSSAPIDAEMFDISTMHVSVATQTEQLNPTAQTFTSVATQTEQWNPTAPQKLISVAVQTGQWNPTATQMSQTFISIDNQTDSANAVSKIIQPTFIDVEVMCNQIENNISTPTKNKFAAHLLGSPASFSCSQNSNTETIGDQESSFQCSSSTSESDSIGLSEDECFPLDLNLSKDKYIVFGSELEKLFKRCHFHSSCTGVVSFQKRFTGIMVTYVTSCSNDHDFVWHSQPLLNRVPLGNLLLSAAVLYTGNTYTTLAEIFECFNLQMFCARTFYDMQGIWLFPTIKSMWKDQQKRILSGTV